MELLSSSMLTVFFVGALLEQKYADQLGHIAERLRLLGRPDALPPGLDKAETAARDAVVQQGALDKGLYVVRAAVVREPGNAFRESGGVVAV